MTRASHSSQGRADAGKRRLPRRDFSVDLTIESFNYDFDLIFELRVMILQFASILAGCLAAARWQTAAASPAENPAIC